MNSKFAISESFASRVATCTPELLSQALSSTKTVGIREEIARLQRELSEGVISPSEFETKKDAAKKRSWCIMPHADFPSGNRRNEDAVLSGLYGFDIDHMKEDPRAWYLQNVAGMEKEAGIGYAEVSLSGNGLHIIGLCPEGLSIEQSQAWLANMLSVTEYDKACKDPARCLFLSGNTLHRDDEMLFSGIGRPTLSAKELAEVSSDKTDKTDNCLSVLTDNYKGVSYDEIVKALVKELGGEPVEGDRNNFIFKLVGRLRTICDNNPDLLLHITPRFGLDENEVKNIIKSATKEPVKCLHRETKAVLLALGVEDANCWRVDDDVIYVYEQEVMRNLPSGLKEIIKPIPENKRMNVLCAVLPVLATYAENITFHHATGEDGYMALNASVIGDFGKGKSLLCKSACDLLLAPINEEDTPGWAANEKYYEKQQTRAANDKIDSKPHPLIRNIASVATAPYILERLKHSKGHCLVCVTDEVQDIISNPTDNAERSKILRKSFDQTVHTVGRVGKDSVTGKVRVKLNTTAMGTVSAMQSFFGEGNVENGLASRFIISFLPHEVGQRWLNYRPYDAKAQESARQLTETLKNRTGEVKTPRIDKAIRQWWEEKNQLVIKHDDEVLGSLINRMAVIGHRCGVLYHIMTGKKNETNASIKFALLMAEYTLREQLRFFGNTLKKIAEKQSATKIQAPSTNKRLLEVLDTEFSLDEVTALKPGVKPASIKRMIDRWRMEELITLVGDKRYRKV